jgi:glycosyltransferase involved in cell wall biosynthesis
MKKVVVVMTAFNRQKQTVRTLDSINESFYPNFEVVIVDDGSPERLKLPAVDYPLHLIEMPQKKDWRDSSVAFNTGFLKAISLGADVVIIQNAECAHMGDIVEHAANNVTNDNYITYACLSLNESDTENKSVWYERAGQTVNAAMTNGETAWYNHSAIRPMGYHFCAAITTESLKKINGFDERFSYGVGFDDDYLKARIFELGLKVLIYDAPFVVHQYHETMHMLLENNSELYERNRQLYYELVELKQYKAEHIFTPDL